MTLHALKGAEKYTKTVSQSDFKELLTVSKGLLKSVKFNASTFVEIRSLFAIELQFFGVVGDLSISSSSNMIMAEVFLIVDDL